jgi:hypothetical protein
MAKQTLNNGEQLYDIRSKINQNFSELYTNLVSMSAFIAARGWTPPWITGSVVPTPTPTVSAVLPTSTPPPATPEITPTPSVTPEITPTPSVVLPNVTITYSVLSGFVPFTVSLSSTNSGGNVDSWSWNVDGTSYSTQNITHTLSVSGVFAASLTATNAAGVSIATTSLTASVSALPEDPAYSRSKYANRFVADTDSENVPIEQSNEDLTFVGTISGDLFYYTLTSAPLTGAPINKTMTVLVDEITRAVVQFDSTRLGTPFGYVTVNYAKLHNDLEHEGYFTHGNVNFLTGTYAPSGS